MFISIYCIIITMSYYIMFGMTILYPAIAYYIIALLLLSLSLLLSSAKDLGLGQRGVERQEGPAHEQR